MTAPRAVRLRVALQGDPAAVETWRDLLSAPGIEVLRPGEAFPDDGVPGISVVVASPSRSGDATPLATPAATPSVVIAGPPDAEHPFTRLVRDIIRSKAEAQSVFDAMVDGVLLLDPDGRALRGNLALAEALGRPVTAIPGHFYTELIGQPLDGGEDPIARGLATGAPETLEARFSLLPGIRQVTTSPMRDEDGKLRGATVAFKDVSELKEQQKRLVQASRLADVGQLAAGVAHEINTPLASIGLRAESLLRSADDPRLTAIDAFKNFPRYLRTIGEEILRCKRIINALLEFSRSRRNELVETDLNAIVSGAADLLEHEVKQRRISLEVRTDPGLPLIHADPGQIRQALLAVLMNSLEATPPGGRVAIEIHAGADGRVRLVVSDTGAGIPPEHMDRVFSPFFTTKPVGAGTGLGLAVCHGVVAAHGGEVRLASHPGGGTRATIELPASASVGKGSRDA